MSAGTKSLRRDRYCGFGNFRVTFISRFFHFRIIREFLNSRASIRAVSHFRGIKICTLGISCERQIDVMYRIAVHVVRHFILKLYSSFCPHTETITLFVTHTDSHLTASESIIRYKCLIDLLSSHLSQLSIITVLTKCFLLCNG